VSGASTPPGYESFLVRRTHVVARTECAHAVRAALATGTLHSWASRQPGAVPLTGRDTAWAVRLPGGPEVVVRHSRHGGALARLTRDLFLAPTRAPHELAVSLRLGRAGVRTPEVIAYAVYPATGPFARADVLTRRTPGTDFPDAWQAAADGPGRLALVRALAVLLRQLREAGALHPDLNLKNVLLAEQDGGRVAFVLDVDRVRFGAPGSREVARRNLGRLLRSARKGRARWHVDLREAPLLAELAASLEPAPGA